MPESPLKINLSSYLIEEALIDLVPGDIVKQYNFMPVFRIGDTLTIATSDPDNLNQIDEIQKHLRMEIDTVYAEDGDIKKAIEHHYGVLDTIESLIATAQETEADKLEEKKIDVIDISESDAEKAPIISLANLIINQAILKKASDIHINPNEDYVLVRLRVDGEMYEMKRFPIKLHNLLVSRFKVMGSMDIAESRIPQDGHCEVALEGHQIELRLSILPTIHGENIVVRILNKGAISYGLPQLGFFDDDMSVFNTLISSPFGMILVTGPTGSGKTTTLYAALNEINNDTRNIITLEDPVEYQLPLIRQVQVNPKAGLTFSSGLRSILRQDPDIIMVGEIRDLDTAELAIRSSLTGHLVFSTLHTNDAPSALIRLIDMGVESFLVSSSVTGVLAQRLVRAVCSKCKVAYNPPDDVRKILGLEKETYIKGKGCKNCSQTGFSGRIGLFELLVLDDDMKTQLVKKASSAELRGLAINMGMKTLQEDGIRKIEAGLTTAEEVLKATQFLTVT